MIFFSSIEQDISKLQLIKSILVNDPLITCSDRVSVPMNLKIKDVCECH